MSPSPADADDWHSVSDAKKRKQIQDRLAQRARRRRLREAKQQSAAICANDGSSHAHHTDALVHCCQLIPEGILDSPPCLANVATSLTSLSPASTGSVETPTVETATSLFYEPGFHTSVLTALFWNGEVLGLSCCSTIPSKSLPVGEHVPASLRPTSTQLLTLHQMGIDRFPFPRMRDNMIAMGGLYDDDEFTRDLFTMPSFSIEPGAPSWEPRAWKVSRKWADKWGFLL